MENREAIERALELSPQMRASEWITAVGQATAMYTDEAKEAFNMAIYALEKQEQDRWIPVTERLPETTDPVNVTWANNDPVSYYEDIRGKRFTATACYHKGKWWWYSAVCQDLLDEYGKSCMDDEIDEAIEILAWRPLPEEFHGE